MYSSWRSHHIEVVETVFRVSGAANGGGPVGEGNTSGVKGSSETIVAKFLNGDEGFFWKYQGRCVLGGLQEACAEKVKGQYRWTAWWHHLGGRLIFH